MTDETTDAPEGDDTPAAGAVVAPAPTAAVEPAAEPVAFWRRPTFERYFAPLLIPIIAVLGIVIMLGYLGLGMFSSRLAQIGITPRHLFAAGFATHTVALASILAGIPGSYAWWSIYGMGAAVNVLSFTVLSAGFAKEFVARANTALNLLVLPTLALRYGRFTQKAQEEE